MAELSTRKFGVPSFQAAFSKFLAIIYHFHRKEKLVLDILKSDKLTTVFNWLIITSMVYKSRENIFFGLRLNIFLIVS